MGRRWGQRSQELVTPSLDTPQVQALAQEADSQVLNAVYLANDNSQPPDWRNSKAGYVADSERKGQTAPDATTSGKGFVRVWWIEKGGERKDATLKLDDPLPVVKMSEAAAEYRCRFRAVHLRSKGWSKEKIGRELDKAAGWVTLWGERAPEEVPRPKDVPPYVIDYELRMLKCGIEPFRPAVLRRQYMTDTVGLYSECAQAFPWRQAVFRKRNYDTGEVTVTNIASSRQDCSIRGLKTGIARLDAALDRVRVEFDIRDPRVYLLNNFYPDGNTSIAPHQHDFWSAILSFGASRVFTLDGQPILLGDGDLLVIGTQRHGVPKMPAVTEGRVSVAIFWYPEMFGTECSQCGKSTELLQEGEDGENYCEDCWRSWQTFSQAAQDEVPRQSMVEDTGLTEDDILAATLEMSLKDF
mmetsp:Transcript_10871/g.19348  ORF Transcript_10871/g.19348 Transcript_10871/m.19348 type:complete len:412 (+) Transcript_10871:146-1381(+)|eukprot:CAMPEP_0197687256 /NCGR_PEP_ID=MMETSP1338-20131121/103726_1 /TAXON_ID=43686 ORGANISM="Pelagodinium beii, Strain RCC1491" /NCGR_SAMPLE_ID=MMETSP1338 /ASSEMBLY_ACC=CAM_ASM_000754 /LENGTH=411 /DNA_ID=CAMNT_0043269333 /DNA_START=123 /DNA_END=1358 /DNA_ORIENTATION=+